jgi:hypothetical protein
MQIATFNPLACGKLEEALAALAAGADLTLTSDQDAAALVIIRSLPPCATIKDFIEACNQHAASKLRVSQETLEAMKPLLVALESAGPWRAADAR